MLTVTKTDFKSSLGNRTKAGRAGTRLAYLPMASFFTRTKAPDADGSPEREVLALSANSHTSTGKLRRCDRNVDCGHCADWGRSLAPRH